MFHVIESTDNMLHITQLYYKESRLVIADKDGQVDIIHDIREGLGDTSHSKATSALLGRTPTCEKIAACFFCYGIYRDVARI